MTFIMFICESILTGGRSMSIYYHNMDEYTGNREACQF